MQLINMKQPQKNLIHIYLGCINAKNHLNPVRAINFKISYKICKKIEKTKGENQAQVQNQECM